MVNHFMLAHVIKLSFFQSCVDFGVAHPNIAKSILGNQKSLFREIWDRERYSNMSGMFHIILYAQNLMQTPLQALKWALWETHSPICWYTSMAQCLNYTRYIGNFGALIVVYPMYGNNYLLPKTWFTSKLLVWMVKFWFTNLPCIFITWLWSTLLGETCESFSSHEQSMLHLLGIQNKDI